MLFLGEGAADIVLLAMAIELGLLVRGGRPLRDAAAAILPGALIALALRAAMTGADWRWIALPLALSLPLHLADLGARGWLGRRDASMRSRPVADNRGQAR